MSPAELEQTLRDLPRVGTLIKDRGYRQVWKFYISGKGYYLKFYPKHGFRDAFRRFFRGSPARAEFEKLQLLQKGKIPAPRAVAALMGFRIEGRVGDAVILEAIEPSQTLMDYLMEFDRKGEPIPNHRALSQQVRTLVHQLGRAGLGHEDLNLGNFLMSEGKLYLLDGYAVHKGGLKLADVEMLAHSARRFCTVTDIVRGWEQLGPGGAPPRRNRVSERIWSSFLPTIWKDNRYFGEFDWNGWSAWHFKSWKNPIRWAPASKLNVSTDDWKRALPTMMDKIASDQFTVWKRKPSGEVMTGEIVLGNRPISVVIKIPKRKNLWRYIKELGRGTRAHREWPKAWQAIVRGWPTAWPLLLMERRVLGVIVESMIIYELVPGKILEHQDLDALGERGRDQLMRRTGRLLRRIEQLGYSHFDAKASNWMVRVDEKTGPGPVMIDMDSIRKRRWIALGIRRLLESMRSNPTYRPSDSRALCEGYTPWSRVVVEEESTEEAEAFPPLPPGEGRGEGQRNG